MGVSLNLQKIPRQFRNKYWNVSFLFLNFLRNQFWYTGIKWGSINITAFEITLLIIVQFITELCWLRVRECFNNMLSDFRRFTIWYSYPRSFLCEQNCFQIHYNARSNQKSHSTKPALCFVLENSGLNSSVQTVIVIRNVPFPVQF